MKETTVKFIKLKEKHKATNKVQHFSDGNQIVDFKELRIVTYENDPGYLIIYFDSRGQEVSDTYHESLQQALDYARWEFNIEPLEWEDIHIEKKY